MPFRHVVALAILTIAAAPGQAMAGYHAAETFAQLGARCAPSINIHTLASVVRQESRFNMYAININGSKPLKRMPTNAAEAVATARRLLDAGYKIDVGLGQISSGNFGWLGLSLSQLFEPCANLAASARVLSACYQRAVAAQGEGQLALRSALSCYNTGSLSKGFKNGYVRAVVAQASRPVPELLPLASGGQGVEPAPLRTSRRRRAEAAWSGGDVFATNADADAFAQDATEEASDKDNQH